MFGAMHFIYYINSYESRFNLFGLLTNSTQRICLVASGGREPVTFRSQSLTLSRYTTHVYYDNYCILFHSFAFALVEPSEKDDILSKTGEEFQGRELNIKLSVPRVVEKIGKS